MDLSTTGYIDLLERWSAIFAKYGVPDRFTPVLTGAEIGLLDVADAYVLNLQDEKPRARFALHPQGPKLSNALDIFASTTLADLSVTVEKRQRVRVAAPEPIDIGLTLENIHRITIECANTVGLERMYNEDLNTIYQMVLKTLALGNFKLPEGAKRGLNWHDRRLELGYTGL